jgi:hypothetical protein
MLNLPRCNLLYIRLYEDIPQSRTRFDHDLTYFVLSNSWTLAPTTPLETYYTP